MNPAGAGTRIEIGPIAGAGPELKVVGLRQTAPIVLQSTDGLNWKFNGQGCVIKLTVNDDDKLYINQSGTCEPYGFVANGPDRQNLDLTGPYFAN